MRSVSFSFRSFSLKRDAVPKLFQGGTGVHAKENPVVGLLWFEFDRRCVTLAARYTCDESDVIAIDRGHASLFLPVPVTTSYGQIADLLADSALVAAIEAVYLPAASDAVTSAVATLRAAYSKHFPDVAFILQSRR